MKIKAVITTSILAGIMQFSPAVLAQDSSQSGKGWRHNQEQDHLASLTPAERQKVEAAHQTAMQDPAVQAAREKMKQARKDLRDAMHTAMLKADPSIQTILDKIPRHEKPGD
jgi:Spy/CpxP family protein refolding chaperone